jgi:excisionase family DNA binding protein
VEKLVLSIEEAARALGISRTRAFAAAREGTLKTYKDGRRRMVSAQAVALYVAHKEAGAGHAKPE